MGRLSNKSKAKRAFQERKKHEESESLIDPQTRIDDFEEQIEQAKEDMKEYAKEIRRLKEIKPQEVSHEDEDYIAERYEDFNEKFVAPKTQGLKELLPKETMTYSIDWGKVGNVELTKSVDADKLTAALEAICGVQVLSEVAFKNEFGVAQADFRAFLGVMGKTEVGAKYDWDAVVLEVVADFFAGAKLTCNGELRAGSVDNSLKAKLSGTATVGIEGVSSATLKLTPGQLSAALELSAFAGAKAEATGEFSAMVFGRELFTQSVTATASVGIGASLSANLDVGVETIGLGFATDLTVGLGAGVEAETKLNVANVVMSFMEAKDRIVEWPNYIKGYKNLGLQDKEWQLKIDMLTKRYEELIKKRKKEIDKINKELKNK